MTANAVMNQNTAKTTNAGSAGGVGYLTAASTLTVTNSQFNTNLASLCAVGCDCTRNDLLVGTRGFLR